MIIVSSSCWCAKPTLLSYSRYSEADKIQNPSTHQTEMNTNIIVEAHSCFHSNDCHRFMLVLQSLPFWVIVGICLRVILESLWHQRNQMHLFSSLTRHPTEHSSLWFDFKAMTPRTARQTQIQPPSTPQTEISLWKHMVVFTRNMIVTGACWWNYDNASDLQ